MKMREGVNVPTYPDLIGPVFKALKDLGGSGSNEDILNKVIDNECYPDEVVDASHQGNMNQTELAYQAAWARTYLKRYGAIENSARSVWSIKPEFSKIEITDGRKIVSEVNRQKKPEPEDIPEVVQPWEDKLMNILQNMDPYAFERLAQRILRECGFTQVNVTKKSDDGGIDGTGKLKINGIFSFNVAFQCKRYRGLVGSPEIRDFRGSLTQNIEKGVMITTGTFSKEARKEAVDPGKQQIDLIDGQELINKIAEYNIGVKPIVTYEVDEEFFAKI